MKFEQLGLSAELVDALKKEKIVDATDVQQKVYESVYEKKDVMAQSQTGSGKTLAYLLPLCERYKNTENCNKVLVLVPTHELAMQVVNQIRRINENSVLDYGVAAIVGDVNIKRQVEALKKKPHFIVGTPGRVLELIKKKKIAAHLLETIVLDEADKLLSRNQIEETKAVIKCCMRDVQKLFFSASMNDEAVASVKEISSDCEIIKLDKNLVVPAHIEHYYIVCDPRQKIETLRSLISAIKPEKTMVFINKYYDIERAADKLKYHHYDAECIHGNTKKEARKQIVEKFAKGKLAVLIGTDIAARGLHFEGVDYVIHYSIPEDEKDYLHRAGRCGRGMECGVNISIVTPAEIKRIRKFEKKLSVKMQEQELRGGMMVPKFYKAKESTTTGKPDKAIKTNKPNKQNKANKSNKTNKPNKTNKVKKTNKSDKTNKQTKSNKPNKLNKSNKPNKPNKNK